MKPGPLLVFLALSFTAGFATAPQPPVADGKVVKLDPFKVRDDPLNSFGFDLRIYYDKKTNKVSRIFFGPIQENSSAAELDVLPGDELVTINGRPVAEFPAGVELGTELGKIFLARKPGDTLDLGIIRHRPGKITVTVASPPRLTPLR
ncbi:MAG: hypothetical protein KF715_20155 [Candidatus Didemnitutus sp.]|nr:hypothetical protein [Candidatus Didemnitutus sp.]